MRKIRLWPVFLIQPDLDPLRTKFSSPCSGSNGDLDILRPQTPQRGPHARSAAKHYVLCYTVNRRVIRAAAAKLVLSQPLNGQVQLRRNVRVRAETFEVLLYFWI